MGPGGPGGPGPGGPPGWGPPGPPDLCGGFCNAIGACVNFLCCCWLLGNCFGGPPGPPGHPGPPGPP